jgi:hypothetical protein
MTTLVSSRMPWARLAMCFETASIIHRLLKGLSISFVEYPVGASKHFGTLLLRGRAEAMDIADDFDLLAQRQVLDTPDDRFDSTSYFGDGTLAYQIDQRVQFGHNLRRFFRIGKRRELGEQKFKIQPTLLSQKDSFDINPVPLTISESLVDD